MRPDPVGSYHDADGARHEVARETRRPDGWQVLDRDTVDARARVDRHAREPRRRPPSGRGDRPRLPGNFRGRAAASGAGADRGHI